MRFLSIALLLVLVTAPRTTFAQNDDVPTAPINVRMSAGLGLTFAQPTGEFRQYIDSGFGIDFNAAIPFDRQGILSARLEGGFTNYGNETIRVPLSSTIGNLIMVDVTTSNNIFSFGVGPQITFPNGPIRPYATTTIGGSYFATQSQVEGSSNHTPFAQSTNFDDFVFSLAAGGGFLIPLGSHEGTRLMLDLGATYHHNGPTRYLREGSLQDIRDESVTIVPIESRASYFNFRVGVVARTF